MGNNVVSRSELRDLASRFNFKSIEERFDQRREDVTEKSLLLGNHKLNLPDLQGSDFQKHVKKLKEKEEKKADPMFDDLPLLNEKYKVLNVLGQGAFGFVLKVLEVETKSLYAIKCIIIDQKEGEEDPEKAFMQKRVLESAKTELDILPELRHENIVGYVESFIDDKHPLRKKKRKNEDLMNLYLVMNFVKGSDMDQLLEFAESRKFNLSPMITIKWFIILLRVLKFCHRRGVTHRDLKPDNILVEYKSLKSVEDMKLVLSDFGVGKKHEGKRMYGEGEKPPGHLYYCPPEVLNGENYDSGYDIFSLGIIFFQLFFGISTATYQNLVTDLQGYIRNDKAEKELFKKWNSERNGTDSLKNLSVLDVLYYIHTKGLFKSMIIDAYVRDDVGMGNLLDKMMRRKEKRVSANKLLKSATIHTWEFLLEQKKKIDPDKVDVHAMLTFLRVIKGGASDEKLFRKILLLLQVEHEKNPEKTRKLFCEEGGMEIVCGKFLLFHKKNGIILSFLRFIFAVGKDDEIFRETCFYLRDFCILDRFKQILVEDKFNKNQEEEKEKEIEKEKEKKKKKNGKSVKLFGSMISDEGISLPKPNPPKKKEKKEKDEKDEKEQQIKDEILELILALCDRQKTILGQFREIFIPLLSNYLNTRKEVLLKMLYLLIPMLDLKSNSVFLDIDNDRDLLLVFKHVNWTQVGEDKFIVLSEKILNEIKSLLTSLDNQKKRKKDSDIKNKRDLLPAIEKEKTLIDYMGMLVLLLHDPTIPDPNKAISLDASLKRKNGLDILYENDEIPNVDCEIDQFRTLPVTCKPEKLPKVETVLISEEPVTVYRSKDYGKEKVIAYYEIKINDGGNRDIVQFGFNVNNLEAYVISPKTESVDYFEMKEVGEDTDDKSDDDETPNTPTQESVSNFRFIDRKKHAAYTPLYCYSGDVVGVGVTNNSNMFFTKNNEMLKNIKIPLFEEGDKIFAHIRCSAKNDFVFCNLNFGEDPFFFRFLDDNVKKTLQIPKALNKKIKSVLKKIKKIEFQAQSRDEQSKRLYDQINEFLNTKGERKIDSKLTNLLSGCVTTKVLEPRLNTEIKFGLGLEELSKSLDL